MENSAITDQTPDSMACNEGLQHLQKLYTCFYENDKKNKRPLGHEAYRSSSSKLPLQGFSDWHRVGLELFMHVRIENYTIC